MSDDHRAQTFRAVGPVAGRDSAGRDRRRRTVVSLTVAVLAALTFVLPALAASGDLDTTFDTDGKITTDFGSDARARAVAIQSNGKIVAAGSADDGSGGGNINFAVTRYNPYGSLDNTFGQDGKVTTSFSPGVDRIDDVAIQPDGKIVAVGYAETEDTTESRIALVRYNGDGTLDTTFGTNGRVLTSSGTSAGGQALAIQPDGKIVVAGRTFNSFAEGGFLLVRYNSDGSLDGGANDSTPGDSFGTGGKVTTDLGNAETANAVALQPNGKIVAAGRAFDSGGSNEDFALARYNADGSLDTDSDADPGISFDTDGKVITDTGSIGESAAGVVVQPGGKIVAAGTSFIGGDFGDRDFTLIRYNVNGSLDTDSDADPGISFGTDGVVTTAIGSEDDSAGDVAIQNGKLVVSGTSSLNSGSVFALARYGPDGSLDSTFSGDGKLTTSISGDDGGAALAIQPNNNKIVAAGSSQSTDGTANNRFALVRYFGNGDTVAPGSVGPLGATVDGSDVSLSWNNPAAADFDSTKVLRSTTGYATSATDAAGQSQVYLGRGTSYRDNALPDDVYYYTAFALDNSGNWSPAARARAVVDVTPPDTTIGTRPASYVVEASARFTFASSEAGSTFQCQLDGSAFTACSSPKDYAGLAQGSHTFRVRAVDAVGRLDPTPAARTWVVDNRAPTGTIVINLGDATTTNRLVGINERASDPSPGSGVDKVRFSQDGTTWSPAQPYDETSVVRLNGGAGVKTVWAQFIDRAGNISPRTRDTIRYTP